MWYNINDLSQFKQQTIIVGSLTSITEKNNGIMFTYLYGKRVGCLFKIHIQQYWGNKSINLESWLCLLSNFKSNIYFSLSSDLFSTSSFSDLMLHCWI